ncbi:MAG: Kelch repeat-containing protein [Pyrinomonadaceae bacterium]
MRSIRLLALFFMGCVCVAQTTSETMHIEWTRASDIPLPRGGYFAAWHDGGLWLAGGSYWKDGKKLWTAETSFYNPQTGKWSRMKPLPKAFGYGVTAVIGGDIYLLGGVDSEGNANKEMYRLRNRQWSKVGESPAAFIYPAYAVVGKKVYIFGGSSSATDVSQATSKAWVYDTASKKWNNLPPIPGDPREIFSASAVGKHVYVFGGLTQRPGEQPSNLNDAYRFDLVRRKWEPIKKLPIAMRAFWAGTDGRDIYLIGGYADAGLDTVYRYSPERDSYELISKLPQPLMDTKFIFNKRIFYGASGEDRPASRFSGLVVGRLTRTKK